MSSTERPSRYERTITLGNLLNMIALIGVAVSCALYVAGIERDGLERATRSETRIEAIERRLDRSDTEVLRRLERIEGKVEAVQQDVSTLKAQQTRQGR